ncbi:hypothetical protein EDC04DRAFT_2626013 [Pisolithus marmoratus]|nr:hypothetical protein EDC04DRAFT_2626013 [Pisolithus marmoratus]
MATLILISKTCSILLSLPLPGKTCIWYPPLKNLSTPFGFICPMLHVEIVPYVIYNCIKHLTCNSFAIYGHEPFGSSLTQCNNFWA